MTGNHTVKPAFKNITFGIISFMWARPFTKADYGIISRARAMGFGAFELVMPEVSAVNFSEIGLLLQEHKLSSSLTARVGSDTDPCSFDPQIRKRARSYLESCIKAAAEINATVVGGPLLGSPLVFAGQAPRLLSASERQKRFDLCVRHLSELVPYAEERGVKLALEPVNRFETDVLNLVEQASELLDAVDAKHTLGILLDTFHANIEEASIPQAIALAGEKLCHVHANENHRGIIGTGHLPWPDIMTALKEIDYHGQVILEPFRRNDNTFSVPLATWRPPLAEEDEQVAQSLQYLKGLLGQAQP